MQDVVCDDDDGDDDCIANHGNDNCNNDDSDMELGRGGNLDGCCRYSGKTLQPRPQPGRLF